MTDYITSADGTRIAFERSGSGPALVIVDGALCSRAMGPSKQLAEALAPAFTVYRYDRRGRGESAAAGPWGAEREIEDLAALIEAAGGEAAVYGISSGAVLALDAAQRLTSITQVVVFEPPIVVDPGPAVAPDDFLPQVRAAVADGRHGDAVALFLRRVGMPRVMLAVMKRLPVWRKLEAAAPTLPHDLELVSQLGRGRPLPTDRWDAVTAPALVLHGSRSPEWVATSATALADLLDAEHRVLQGQNHMAKAAPVAAELVDFLARGDLVEA